MTTLRLTLAALHLLALGIGLGAIWSRARALRQLDAPGGAAGSGGRAALDRVLTGDTWWAVAGILWLSTGIWRAVGGTEKVPDYYWTSAAFHVKMGLFTLVIFLETANAGTLVRWRRAAATMSEADVVALAPQARRLAIASDVQALAILLMVVMATLMARGYLARWD